MLLFHPHLMDPVRIDVPTPSRASSVTIGGDSLERLGTLDAIGAPARRYTALMAR
jgi:hypothetical protein